MQAFQKHNTLAKNMDQAFVTTGFRNWKRAIEKCTIHEQSQAHKVAITTHTYQNRTIETQLSTAREQQQIEARSCLLKIVQTIRVVARQGIAFRGHESDEGNLNQFLQLRALDDDVLKRWLKSSNHYTSPEIQNEIGKIMANTIIRTIANTVQGLPTLQYSIIIDGTQDVSGVEQEAICLRYVDSDLLPHEDFVGLYEVYYFSSDGH